MGGLDWILIAIYLLIMLGIGFTSMKKVKTNEDYALAGRSVGNFWVILSLFASWTRTFRSVRNTAVCIPVWHRRLVVVGNLPARRLHNGYDHGEASPEENVYHAFRYR